MLTACVAVGRVCVRVSTALYLHTVKLHRYVAWGHRVVVCWANALAQFVGFLLRSLR
jgi:hypothetical protein